MGVSAIEFEKYIKEARERYLKEEFAVSTYIRNIFARTANTLRDFLYTISENTLRRTYYNELLAYIERISEELNDELVKVIAKGQKIAIDVHKENAKSIFEEIAKGIWKYSAIESLFATVNERSLLSLTNRTEAYGLKVSDRVWNITTAAKQELTRAVEDAVATVKDPRKLAKEIQHLLNPGVWTPLRKETRKRLGVSRDVSMEAMRLAVSEMQHASHEGAIASYSLIPTCKGFYWRLSNSHPIEDICDTYARHNGDGFFKKDEVPVKPHPWCRCYVVPRMDPPDRIAKLFREWLSNPLEVPVIENWYQQVKPFLPRPSPSLLSKITQATLEETRAKISGVKRWRRAKSLDEAMEIAKELEIADVVYYSKESMSLPIANIMNRAIFNIVNEFPQLKNSPYFKRVDGTLMQRYFKFLVSNHPDDFWRDPDGCLFQRKYWDEFKEFWEKEKENLEHETTIGHYFPRLGLVAFHYRFTKPGKFQYLKRCMKELAISKYFPPNCDTPLAVVYHEMGHAIYYTLGLNDEFLRAKWEYFNSLSLEEKRELVSEYAAESHEEMVAEAWASYCMKKYENKGRITNFVKEIGEYITAKLREL